MLKLKPNCELCDKDLPAHAPDARICSYECTFCADCVQYHLHNVCPNCGGNFVPRPLRPNKEWRPGTGLKFNPASDLRVVTKRSLSEIETFVAQIRDLDPHMR